jgi:phosphopantetheinyl transferase
VAKRNESISYFLNKLTLSNTEIAQFYGFKPKRILEWLSSRYLVSILFESDNRVVFGKDEFGKPYIKGSDKFISLSHCDEMVAAVISDHKVGVDIEKIDHRLIKVKEKFASESDLIFHDNEDEVRFLTRLWTIKEAVYKAYGKKELSFKDQIKLNSEGGCTVLGEDGIKIHYSVNSKVFEDYYFTIACLENYINRENQSEI